MASPQQHFEDGAPDPEGGQDGAYDQSQSQAASMTAASKKKRAYAGQAYEFGAGANNAQQLNQAPQQPMGGYGYQQPGQQPAYGMPQQPAYGNANVQSPVSQPGYGQPQYGAQGGYEPPAPGYPVQGQQGVQGMTQQFSQMGVAGQQPQQAPQQPAAQLRLNPLQPADISMQGQPFHVSELDQPPPPIILPPNVSEACCQINCKASLIIQYSLLLHLHPMRIAHLNMSDPPSMRCLQQPHF